MWMEAKDCGLEDPLSSHGECTRTRTERGTKTATTPVNRHPAANPLRRWIMHGLRLRWADRRARMP
jgi:hypothetical protein